MANRGDFPLPCLTTRGYSECQAWPWMGELLYFEWPTPWHVISTFYLASILTFFPAVYLIYCILTFFLAVYLASILTFFLAVYASILTFFLAVYPIYCILTFFLAVYLASILTFFLAVYPIYCINSDILSGSLPGIHSGILSGSLFEIYSEILPGSLSDIYSDIPFGSLSDIYSDILSGILSDICSDMGVCKNPAPIRLVFHDLPWAIFRFYSKTIRGKNDNVGYVNDLCPDSWNPKFLIFPSFCCYSYSAFGLFLSLFVVVMEQILHKEGAW